MMPIWIGLPLATLGFLVAVFAFAFLIILVSKLCAKWNIL